MRFYYLLACSIAVVWAWNNHGSYTPPVTTSVAKPTGGAAEIFDALAFDVMKKAHAETGVIPPDALYNAWLELKNRGYYTLPAGSKRDGDGWTQVNDYAPSLAVTKITYDPSNTQTFYFCTGEGWYNADAVRGAGVFKSEDGGETWTQLESTNNSNFYYCQDIDVHPITGDVYVATRSGGLQRSTDGGITWEKVLGSGVGALRNSICDVEITSDGGVFVGIGIFETDGIYYSPNGNPGTYNKQTVGLPAGGYFRIELAVAPSNPDIAYAIPCSTNYQIQGIYRTNDRGTTWQATELPGDNLELAASQAWYDLIIEVDPSDPNTVIAGGLHLWRSRDGGTTWQQISTGSLDSSLVRYVHVDQHAVVFRSSDEVYFGNDGGIYKSTNFTSDNPIIYHRNDGYNVTQYYATALSGIEGDPMVIGGTQDNGSQVSLYSNLGAFKSVSGADGAFCAVNNLDPDIFYTTTQFKRMYRFTNGGFEWPDTITNPYVENNNVLFINPMEIDPEQPEQLYMASNIGLWRLDSASTARDSSWEKACSLGGSISAIAVSVNPPDIVFIGRNTGNAEPFRLMNASTVDNSSSPISLDPLNFIPDAGAFGASRYCSSIAVDRNDANRLLVSYSNYGFISVWMTTNALSDNPEWVAVEGDFPDVPVNWAAFHPTNPNVAYIATELGVFYTNQLDGDATQWIPSSTMPVVRTDMLRIRASDYTIVAATHGRGIWEARLDPEGINNDLVWIERGPTNIGGRTRAILIDPNDPTGQTVWAGSVSGGLWRTTQIDDISNLPNTQPGPMQLAMFPNPVTSNVFSIQLPDMPNEKIRLTLFQQATGQQVLVYNQIYLDESGSAVIPINRLKTPPGSYLCVIQGAAGTVSSRLLIL